MYQRSRSSAKLAGIFCVILVLLFTGLAYATGCPIPDPGVVFVDKPDSSDTLISRQVTQIALTINPTATRPFQYRLYLRCGASAWDRRNIITIRQCDYYGRCPSPYYWEVPLVTSTQSCQIGVELLDANFGVLDCDASEIFLIQPASVSPGTLSLGPLVKPDIPGGSAPFAVSGGTPPYKVGTLLNNKIDFSITTVNGFSSVQTLAGPASFTVGNTLSDPCTDTTVVVGVQDSKGEKAFSLYFIDCP